MGAARTMGSMVGDGLRQATGPGQVATYMGHCKNKLWLSLQVRWMSLKSYKQSSDRNHCGCCVEILAGYKGKSREISVFSRL